jgi:hypothetical protein
MGVAKERNKRRHVQYKPGGMKALCPRTSFIVLSAEHQAKSEPTDKRACRRLTSSSSSQTKSSREKRQRWREKKKQLTNQATPTAAP